MQQHMQYYGENINIIRIKTQIRVTVVLRAQYLEIIVLIVWLLIYDTDVR